MWIEFFKLKKLKVFVGSMIFFAFIALMLGLLIFISKHPQIMGSSDILYAKPSVFINADWPFFLRIMIQFISMMGILGTDMQPVGYSAENILIKQQRIFLQRRFQGLIYL